MWIWHPAAASNGTESEGICEHVVGEAAFGLPVAERTRTRGMSACSLDGAQSALSIIHPARGSQETIPLHPEMEFGSTADE